MVDKKILNWKAANTSIIIIPRKRLRGAPFPQRTQPGKELLHFAGVFVKVFIVCNSFPLYLSGWQNLQLGNVLIQHYPWTLSLFITGIKIVPNGHSRQGKLNTRKDSIQFPIKFRRKANNFRDNRSWTGTHTNSTPQIILFSPKLILTAAISSESWNLHPQSSSTPANPTCINSSIIWFSPDWKM